MIKFIFRRATYYCGECGSERKAWASEIEFPNGYRDFTQTRTNPGPPTFWKSWTWACEAVIRAQNAVFVTELRALLASHGVQGFPGGWFAMVTDMAAFPGDHEVWGQIKALRAKHNRGAK